MGCSAGVAPGEGTGRWPGSWRGFPISERWKGSPHWEKLPVPWLWQGVRCLPGLVHVKIHCLAFNSLPDQFLEVLTTACSQNNTQHRFFQLRSAESCYLPISRWWPPRALVIPGSRKPECDPTGRFPRHLERTPDAPGQLSGLLTASFQRKLPLCGAPPAAPHCLSAGDATRGPQQPSACPQPSETGKIFLEARVLTWNERERLLALGAAVGLACLSPVGSRKKRGEQKRFISHALFRDLSSKHSGLFPPSPRTCSLISERGEGRGKRERNIDVREKPGSVASHTRCVWGAEQATQACDLTGN